MKSKFLQFRNHGTVHCCWTLHCCNQRILQTKILLRNLIFSWYLISWVRLTCVEWGCCCQDHSEMDDSHQLGAILLSQYNPWRSEAGSEAGCCCSLVRRESRWCSGWRSDHLESGQQHLHTTSTSTTACSCPQHSHWHQCRKQRQRRSNRRKRG